MISFLKIGANPFFQMLGLADIQQCAIFIVIAIYPGFVGQSDFYILKFLGFHTRETAC